MKGGYTSTCGEPIVIDADIRKTIGNIGKVGYVDVEATETGLEAKIIVGDLYSYPNQSSTPVMNYGDILFDAMDAFMDDDFMRSDALIADFFDNDDIVTYSEDYNQDHIKASEQNVEYCFLKDKEELLGKILEDEKEINLMNPSKGTIVRMNECGYGRNIGRAYVVDNKDKEYKDTITHIASEYKIEIEFIEEHEIDVDKMYYLGCQGYLGQKYSLNKFFGFDPNFYSAMCNGYVDSIVYNNKMTSIKYSRSGHKRISINYYCERKIFRYGCDYLYDRYKTASSYNDKFGMCHDLLSSFQIGFGRSPIIHGRFFLANCYVLVGDYTHDDNGIYDNKGKKIYTTSPLNHNCRFIDPLWKVLNTDGNLLRRASYLIGMFSSRCVFIGKKVTVIPGSIDNHCCIIDKKYYKFGDNKDAIVLYRDNLGKIEIKKGVNKGLYLVAPLFAHNNELWQYFKSVDYCYGTYHNIVQSVDKVDDNVLLREIENAFTMKD